MSHDSPKPLQEISYLFALQIVSTTRSIMENRKEYVLSKQLMRSGTSVGANIEESQYAQSRADFISKLSVALKEASESRYWILLLRDCGYFDNTRGQPLLNMAEDIIRILVKSIKTAKGNV